MENRLYLRETKKYYLLAIEKGKRNYTILLEKENKRK
jgi:hypothetical protein